MRVDGYLRFMGWLRKIPLLGWLGKIRAWFDLSDIRQPHATPITTLQRGVVEEAEDVIRSDP